MFAWSTEPGGGPAVLPSVCCAFGTAVVQPAGLRCRNVAGAPLLGCEFYPMYQFKSLRPSRQADSGNNSLPEVLAALFPQGDAFHILAEEWVEVCWVPTLEMLHCCLWAVGAPRCSDVGQPRAGGGRRRRAGGKVLPSAGEHSAASTAVLTANSHRGLHVAGREQCAGVCMPFRTQ